MNEEEALRLLTDQLRARHPRPLVAEPDAGNSNRVLLCPGCGGDFVHIHGAHISAREEGEEFREIRVNAISGAIDPYADQGPGEPDRRQRISLLGYCEYCGWEFAIVFRQHKGQTYIESTGQ